MKQVFIPLFTLLLVFTADVHGQTRRSDTISVKFSMCETIRGDTVMFTSPTTYEGLKRFFQRNLRYPGDIDDTVETTLCKLYFMIDTKGHVTDAGCAAGPPEALAREVIRVACKLGTFEPGYVKGKPVVTRVETRILFHDLHIENLNQLADDHKADILVGAGVICRLPADRGHPH
jgi:hypothetical protein